jgi:hypothetical protein
MVFLPQSRRAAAACEQVIERAIRYEGQVLLGWRDVPRDNRGLAQAARDIEPVVRQVFIGAGTGIQDRRSGTQALHHPQGDRPRIQALKLADGKMFYVPSMSGAHRGLQGHAAGLPGRRVLPRPAGSAPFPRWPWCTSASPPTPSRPGTWHIRSA